VNARRGDGEKMGAAARTVVVTGSASGLGAATKKWLREAGDRVIGVDVRDADIVADLGAPDGRRHAIDAVRELSGGAIDGLVTFAGVGGAAGRSGALLVSINYFGTVVLAEGLRELLAKGHDAAAVVISSNTTTTIPTIDERLIEACLAGDEERARAIGDEIGSLPAYPTTKTALARWMRHRAVGTEWIGCGITLNALPPGLIDTPLTKESRADPIKGPVFDKFPVPVGRLGRPDEVAALVAFLLGPHARFFCGSLIFCDGGSDALLRPDDWPTPATTSFLELIPGG
jgi:NAD(P)-dependent dehydrogenase (short-subunit alcohol dehydrogenase family)